VTYAVGTASLLAVIAIVGWSAVQVRGALLPAWTGPPARLAEGIIGIAWIVAVGEVLGTLRLLAPLPIFVVLVLGAGAIGLAARRRERAGHVELRPARPSPREEIVAAAVAAAVVGAQWISHVAAAYHRGMTHPDTLWYHASFTARFVQNDRLFARSSTVLEGLATTTHTFWPLDSSLVHALAALAYDGDFLSPLLNLGWAGLALLSAWCIGRRHGGGALAVLGAVVVLGLPAIAGTQPGQAANDVMSAGLCLAAVALLIEAQWRPVPVALAGVAAGLAIGTKLTMAIPIVVLTVGVVVHALRARAPRVAMSWCAALGLSGSFWFVRNWIVIGNPVPWWSIHVGPIHFDAVFHEGDPIGQYLFNGSVWHRYFWPGLSYGFGHAWPLFLLLGMAGVTWGIVRSRSFELRLAAVAALLGGFGYLVTPKNGELGGAVFVLTIRFLALTYFIGLALLAVALQDARPLVRRLVCAGLLVLVVVDAAASQNEGLPAWPREGIIFGALAGVLVLVVVLLPHARRVTVAVTLVALVAAGPLVRAHYLDNRYEHAGLDLDYIFAVLHDTRHERIAVIRSEQLYPMFGDDLSNVVTKVGPPLTADCRGWKDLLVDGGFTYVVVGHGAAFGIELAPDPSWIADDPAARVVVTDGASALYRIDGRLVPAGCR
jgi:hypothetical protein